MAKTTSTILSDAHPMAFVNGAREYFAAACALLELSERASKEHNGQRQFGDSVYFLYYHAIELALKAYLRYHDLPILGTKRKGHEILRLYEECRKLGLFIGPDDQFQIRNIIDLLESSNIFQGLRYFNLKPRTLPDLDWTRITVGKLIDVVRAHVAQRFPESVTPGPPARMDLIMGKPIEK